MPLEVLKYGQMSISRTVVFVCICICELMERTSWKKEGLSVCRWHVVRMSFACRSRVSSRCFPVSATIIKNTSRLIFSQCSRPNVLRKIWNWTLHSGCPLLSEEDGISLYIMYMWSLISSSSFSIWLNKLCRILSLSKTCDLLVERHF